jgi:uncharacterized membrane protein YoaK (UPF0700 family)
MAVATGAVDAVSVLGLGRVFVANMTGNVVFLGFALAGAPGFSASGSLMALGGFLVGAAIGGRLFTSIGTREVAQIAACEALLCGAATIVVAAHGAISRDAMTVMLAVAMGGQTASVRRLAVPDMTTTVLTSTLTALAADRPDLADRGSYTARRLGSVAALLGGAVAGALLMLNTSIAWALGTAASLLASVAVAAGRG